MHMPTLEKEILTRVTERPTRILLAQATELFVLHHALVATRFLQISFGELREDEWAILTTEVIHWNARGEYRHKCDHVFTRKTALVKKEICFTTFK